MSIRLLMLIIAAAALLAACDSNQRNRADDAAFTTEQRNVLSLDYDAFDQTLGEGWRAWSDGGEYAEAARMLDHYASTHGQLTDSQRRVIRFHAGQMYGFLNESDTAIERFEASINPEEPDDSPFRWNAYVRGTIAFLERDLPTLQACREELTTQAMRTITMPDGQTITRTPNLDVLDRFIKHFDRTYREAYMGNIDDNAG